ncbi:MAG: hypothetical protein EOP54_19030 [Sphingobacteriales bacterium]|nr:MAG: hypothetical protein EOP54_19030 [Sphingobacteriales bacterium]
MRMLRIVFCSLCMFAAYAGKAQRTFMKVLDPNQINGESLQQGFQNWSEVTALNAGSTAELSATSNPTPARPETKCFTFSMRQDKTTYYFKKEMYIGSNLASIQFDVVKNTGSQAFETYYRVFMENAYVTAIEEAVSEDGATMVNISVVPRRFRYTYWPQNPNGSLGTPVVFGWDNGTNQSW